MAKSFCLKIIDVKPLEINIMRFLKLKNGFKKGREIGSRPSLRSFIVFGNFMQAAYKHSYRTDDRIYVST